MNHHDMIREVSFEKLKVAVQVNYSLKELAFLRNHAEVETRIDQHSQRLVIQLTSFVLAKRREDLTESVYYPADWWQAFKARWFPRWALKRWPTRTIMLNITTVYYCCPHADIPNNGRYDAHFMWLLGEHNTVR